MKKFLSLKINVLSIYYTLIILFICLMHKTYTIFASTLLHLIINTNMMQLRKYAIASICNRWQMKHPQTQIAEICGVAQSQVSRWWNILIDEDASIPSDHLRTIAGFLKVDMEDLYQKKPHSPATP